MQQKIKHYLLITLGWLAVLLGVIGILLPLVPTTPFLILALACFAESSPRFHKMLLNNKWFGPPLHEWEKTHTIQRHIKHRIMALVVISFSVSIAILSDRLGLQIMLLVLGLAVLILVARLKEPEEN
jgi:uncharacterized membrane protein YbaN (DUF454 family)